MEAFVALDVAIGLAFMYLLLSLLCTALNEWMAGLFRLRAKTLKTAVSRLVDDPPAKNAKAVASGDRLSSEVFKHPLITSLTDGKRGPSYIPAPRFVAALKDAMASLGGARGEGDQPPVREATASQRNATTRVSQDVAYVSKQLTALRSTAPPRVY